MRRESAIEHELACANSRGNKLATGDCTLGLTSSFGYGAGGFVEQLTTPYGTTTFRHEAQVGHYGLRYIEATDPSGATERLTFALDLTITLTLFSIGPIEMSKPNRSSVKR